MREVTRYLATLENPSIGGFGSVDAKILTARLNDEPTNLRDMHDLGMTFKYLLDYEQSAKWFQRRIDGKGDDDERWHAIYMLAMCQEKMGNDEAFITGCWAAYDALPSRAEPLYWLAKHHRNKRQFSTAAAVCEIGVKIPPPGLARHLEPFPYQWGFVEEISIIGFYLKGTRYDAGRAACEHLAANCSVEASREQAVKNLAHYKGKS